MKGEKIIKIARQNNFTVTECKGSHFKLIAPTGEVMTGYHGEMSKGVTCKIIKWLLKFGILLAMAIIIYGML